MYKSTILLTLSLVLLLCCTQRANACSCVQTPSPCASFQSTPVVFVGFVKSIEEDLVEGQRFGKVEKIRTGLTSHFIVEEPLKGIKSQEVDVVTGGGGGDCGYPFKAGERYLVYAYHTERQALDSSASRTVIGGQKQARHGNALTTGICGRTSRLSNAQDDLDIIHALLEGKPQSRIFGVVNEFTSKLGDSSFGKGNEYKPKAGLTVIAEGAAQKYETSTDGEGRFRLNDVKPGKYKVRLVLPATYGMQFSFRSNETEVKVTAGCWSAEINFTVRIDGRIGGRIYNAEGNPVGEQTRVTLITYESAGKGIESVESRNEYTNKEGYYEFDGVPAGRYLLGVNVAAVPDGNTPYPTTYYLHSNKPAQATIIELKEGQKLIDFDIHLPPRLEEQKITGIVLTQNGKPAVGAEVVLYDIENPAQSVWKMAATTGEDGRFTITCYKGRRYKIRAYLSEDYFAGKGVQSDMINVDDNDSASEIRLTLNKPGVFLDRK